MTLELIVGPMFAGKTREMNKRVNIEEIARKKVGRYNPVVNDRDSKTHIVSHDNEKVRAYQARDAVALIRHLRQRPADVVAIDEIQFFDDRIIDFLRACSEDPNIRVIATCLNLDFRREPSNSTSLREM